MHILIAPNAFKHAVDAATAAEAIQRGLQDSRLPCTSECFPIGDGGNGTCRLIIDRLKGELVALPVLDPLGRPVTAAFGVVNGGKTAVIEMADATGLHLLEPAELDPLHAQSYGTGQLIRAALDHGAGEIIVGMGGSATVDGGSGMLRALGARFLDGAGEEITDLPFGLEALHTIDLSGLDRRLQEVPVTVLCDVANPLLGPHGAAHVFGPQKGASTAQVKQLDKLLARYAAVIRDTTGEDVSARRAGGVAGGASAGLAGLLGATLVDGIDYFLDLTRFDAALSKSHLVITGEGSIDSQTLQGKGPYGVASRAKRMGLPVIGLAGHIPTTVGDDLAAYFDTLVAIGNGPSSLEAALAATADNLTRTATQLGNLLAVSP
ncbi:glycerate kinase [Parapedobacter sp. 10938]|uniref:glycerate kinase n=1 Tax=Parapedobacter flavus TaxID=3110225 RepID=UPI002DB89372|nr:glycerate kinase [Parapedobacter sp. 10938]MEC3879352.1 glycerate kinase [Parapedobacter sp. 10938]